MPFVVLGSWALWVDSGVCWYVCN